MYEYYFNWRFELLTIINHNKKFSSRFSCLHRFIHRCLELSWSMPKINQRPWGHFIQSFHKTLGSGSLKPASTTAYLQLLQPFNQISLFLEFAEGLTETTIFVGQNRCHICSNFSSYVSLAKKRNLALGNFPPSRNRWGSLFHQDKIIFIKIRLFHRS